jgi:hypothetical protein
MAGDDGPTEHTDTELTLQADILGELANNHAQPGRYDGGAPNHAYIFHASKDDEVTADVHLESGHALAFITDPSFNVLAEDADGGGADATVRFKVGETAGHEFRLAFRDERATASAFSVNVKTCDKAAEREWRQYQFPLEECAPNGPKQPVCDGALPIRFLNACGCGCAKRHDL